MGQVTIYIEDDIEKKMVASAKAAAVSKSKWISNLIREKLTHQWPESVIQLAGAWQDFPEIKHISHDQDVPRESF